MNHKKTGKTDKNNDDRQLFVYMKRSTEVRATIYYLGKPRCYLSSWRAMTMRWIWLVPS
jgi:hypothetical protein